MVEVLGVDGSCKGAFGPVCAPVEELLVEVQWTWVEGGPGCTPYGVSLRPEEDAAWGD